MKKSLMLLTASILLSSGVCFAGYSDPTFAAHKINNTQDNQKETYREIKLVRYGGNTANDAGLASGDAVSYDLVSADGVTVWKQKQSSDQAFAGIVCTTIPSSSSSATIYSDDNGRGNWGYIVVHGMANATAGAGGTSGNAFGDPFILSTDAGKIGALPFVTGTVSATDLRMVATSGGYFMQSADGTSTSYKVFVRAE